MEQVSVPIPLRRLFLGLRLETQRMLARAQHTVLVEEAGVWG